ncbi:hypothetical protein AKJ16_DCAP22143 [Drosera capensis]
MKRRLPSRVMVLNGGTSRTLRRRLPTLRRFPSSNFRWCSSANSVPDDEMKRNRVTSKIRAAHILFTFCFLAYYLISITEARIVVAP